MSKHFEPQGLGSIIFKDRYAKDENETWHEASRRVAKHVAAVDNDVDYYTDAFYEQIASNKFNPGGRIWYGAGREKAQLLNCFVIPTDDSREGWAKTASDTIIISSLMGGIGINVSPVRPRGSEIKGTGGYSTGSVSLMELINGVGDVIVGGGGRRMALMLCLDIDHPDMEEFLEAKLDLNKLNNANVSLIIPKDFRVEDFVAAVVAGDEIPLQFNGVQSGKTVNAKDLWDRLVKNAWTSGEPGVLNSNFANRMSNIFYIEDLISTNPCFAGSEYLLTENGYQSFNYLYKEGTPNNIWADGRVSYADDGKEESPEKWKIDLNGRGAILREASEVFLTRESTEIKKIILKDGHELRVTPDHLVATETGMKQAQDLTTDDKVLVSVIDPVNGVGGQEPLTLEEIEGLLMGLIAGDGTFSKGTLTEIAHVSFWGEDRFEKSQMVMSMIDKLFEQYGSLFVSSGRPFVSYYTSEYDNKINISSSFLAALLRDRWGFSRDTKHSVPEGIMASARSRVALFYVAGMFYSDGTVQTSPGRYSVRLAQSDKQMLMDIQLILQANGIYGPIYLRREAQDRDMPDGRGGLKKYATKANYELIITGTRNVFAETVGFWNSYKDIKLKGISDTEVYKKTYSSSVVDVIDDGIEDVFCLKEDIGRNIIVQGVSAVRCGEIWLSQYDSCCLGALVLPRFVEDGTFNFNEFEKSIRLGVRFLDNVLTVNHFPLPEIEEKSQSHRRIGLGIMGLHTMLLELGMNYDSSESFAFVDSMFEFMKNIAYDESIALAIEKGPFKGFDERFLDGGFAKTLNSDLRERIRKYGIRNCALMTIAPTGTTSMVSGVSSALEPYPPAVYWRNYFKPTDDGRKVRERELVVEDLFYKYPDTFQSAIDVPVRSHFEMQRIAQSHIDNAVSKTICLKNDFKEDDLGDIWLEYLPHLKGTTIYRYGSRENEPINPIPREEWDQVFKENNISNNYISIEETLDLDCPSGVCDVGVTDERSEV